MNRWKPKVKAPDPHLIGHTTEILRTYGLTTVCEAAACPNRSECYARHSATFMILGDTCTRACRFCHVKTGRGMPADPTEPQRVAEAVSALGLHYVVVTSVDRDDLEDYGSEQFAKVTAAIKARDSAIKVELLTPDFRAEKAALSLMVACGADKLAHNQETVRRLSRTIRPQSDYDRSLQTLRYYSEHFDGRVKSSLMAGLGEHEEELLETMADLRDAGVEELTLGQYLQPTPAHHPVMRYYPPEWFEKMKEQAYAMGFLAVASGALVRSSYGASEL
ncbi:MAG: lipoyl synthase [Sulfurovum sp.]|nr:lipoyl synthase [Sulfurovum sp.]